jgi:exosortase/archaeosortase family protein
MISLVPIAVLKNGVRIAALSWLGVYWDQRILASDLHTKGGFVFFIIALVLAGGVTVLLRKAEGRLSLKDKDPSQ